MSKSGYSDDSAEEQPAETTATKVLLVDDERMLREAYADLLEEEFAVVTAGDGETALTAMTDDIDVVLLDRRMPGLDGADVLEKLREDGYDVPVIVVSAVNPDLEKMEQRVDAYLFKPVGREKLLTTVEQLLSSE